jgi:hypothetical protein
LDGKVSGVRSEVISCDLAVGLRPVSVRERVPPLVPPWIARWLRPCPPPSVTAHPHPCSPQNVASVVPVIQRMEALYLTPLGTHPKLALEVSYFIGGDFGRFRHALALSFIPARSKQGSFAPARCLARLLQRRVGGGALVALATVRLSNCTCRFPAGFTKTHAYRVQSKGSTESSSPARARRYNLVPGNCRRRRCANACIDATGGGRTMQPSSHTKFRIVGSRGA